MALLTENHDEKAHVTLDRNRIALTYCRDNNEKQTAVTEEISAHSWKRLTAT